MQKTTIDLFAGLGGIRLPFDELGYQCVYGAEIAKGSRRSYAAFFGSEPDVDLYARPVASIPEHDVLLAGFPCQPFSTAGLGKGFRDERGQGIFAIIDVLKAKTRSAFLLENVPNIMRMNKGMCWQAILKLLSEAGFKVYYKILNAYDFGLPAQRERVFLVGFRDHTKKFQWPTFSGRRKTLSEILEDDEDVAAENFRIPKNRLKELHDLFGDQLPAVDPQRPKIWHSNYDYIWSFNEYACVLLHHRPNHALVDGRRLITAREALRLHGFPDKYPITCSERQTRAQVGNSVAVPVVRHIARQIDHALTSPSTDTQPGDPYQADLFT